MATREGPEPYRLTVTRFVRHGKRVPKGTPGARKITKKTRKYYADVTIDGKRRHVPLRTRDLGKAWAELNRILRREEDREAGIVDRSQDQARRPLAEHIADWKRHLSAKGTSAKHIGILEQRVTDLAATARWRRLPDLSADSCLGALGKLQETGGRGGPEGRSAQTRNHYLSAVKQFARWAWRGHRLKEHPLAELDPISVESDRRHDRRVPTDAEVEKFFTWLAGPGANVLRRKMTGPQRALGYKVAMATGLRAQELSSLKRDSFDLDDATVTVHAAYEKTRKMATIRLPAWLVTELREWFAAGGALWRFPILWPGRILQADLKAAGVPYVVAGRHGNGYFDFHALRHYYVTKVANIPGINPRTLIELTRHKSITLAMKTYAKAQQQNVKDAVEQLPPIGAQPAPEPVRPKKKRR